MGSGIGWWTIVWPFSGILGGLGAERWVECGWSFVEGGEV